MSCELGVVSWEEVCWKEAGAHFPLKPDPKPNPNPDPNHNSDPNWSNSPIKIYAADLNMFGF